MKLVSEGMLEKVKHSFRLSRRCVVDERAPVKEKEKAPPKPKPNAGSSVLRQQVRKANRGRGGGEEGREIRRVGGRDVKRGKGDGGGEYSGLACR